MNVTEETRAKWREKVLNDPYGEVRASAVKVLLEDIDELRAAQDEAVKVLKGLMVAYGAVDGRNGNSGECWDNARGLLERLGLWTKDRGFI